MNIIHALEQLQAVLRDIAPILNGYKKELIKQGFSEKEAFDLVRDYQKILFEQNSKK